MHLSRERGNPVDAYSPTFGSVGSGGDGSDNGAHGGASLRYHPSAGKMECANDNASEVAQPVTQANENAFKEEGY
jgi:hypothetical protein